MGISEGEIQRGTLCAGWHGDREPPEFIALISPMLSAVEEVEVITSGFAAEYGNAMSGVINISTKEGGDSWRSRAEIRTRTPNYKHFGAVCLIRRIIPTSD